MDGIEEGVTFDFTPNKQYKVTLEGYSKDLSANIVLSPFSRRHVCIKLNIPDEVKSDIAQSLFVPKRERKRKAELVKEIFERNFE